MFIFGLHAICFIRYLQKFIYYTEISYFIENVIQIRSVQNGEVFIFSWTRLFKNLYLNFRLVIADLNESRTAKDLAEQCIKVLELICTREAGAVFEAGGLTCVLGFIRDNGSLIHKDTLHSAMSVVSRLCTKMEPHEDSLGECVECLSRYVMIRNIWRDWSNQYPLKNS